MANKGLVKATLTGILLAHLLSGCGSTEEWTKTELKDMSSSGYEYSFYQRARGTEHNREIGLFVDRMAKFPNPSFNLIEGSYENTGTEAPEHLRNMLGIMIFTQNENRRYYDFWDNAREDATNIMLFDPANEQLYNAAMARFKTEWWGDADVRAISVNNGPVQLRMSGVTNHLGIETQQVFAVVLPYENQDYSWMFDQDKATDIRQFFEGLEKKLEATSFNPSDYHVLISTRDSDGMLDWLGLQTVPAQGELFDGELQYVISAGYMGPHNSVFAGRGFLGSKVYAHQGAPDKSTLAGASLDTVTLALGTIDNPSSWIPKAEIIVNHPTWSNQVEYEFYSIKEDGTRELRGVLQRTYNDKTVTESSGDTTVITDLASTNDYLAKGDLDYINQCLILMGGQQIPLGFDYKTSYMDYALDLIRIADGSISNEGMEPEMVASLNVNADATIENVINAAEGVFGVSAPAGFYSELREKQRKANEAYQQFVCTNQELVDVYGLSRCTE